jgi:hypothetical protein
LQQLRDRSCVRGKMRTWVSGLSDAQLFAVFIRLRNGENSKSIARFVKEAWAVNPESSVHAVAQGLTKFKKRIAHLLVIPPTAERNNCPMPYSRSFNTEEETLESLDQIAKLHRARIKNMLDEEKTTGVRYPFLNRDVQALAQLQKLIIKQKVYESFHDDPLKRKRMSGLEKDIQQKFDTCMKQTGEDERIRMVAALDKMLEHIEEHAFTGEVGPDGKMHLTKVAKK